MQDLNDLIYFAEESVSQARKDPSGTIRVAGPVTLAQTTIGPILPQFLERYLAAQGAGRCHL